MTQGTPSRTRRARPATWLGAALVCTSFATLSLVAVVGHADTPAPAATTASATPTATASTAVVAHPDVQRALDYKLPESTCAAPVVRRRNQNPGQAEAYDRKLKFYFKCVEDYQKGLYDDFKFMQTSVSHGVSMAQAAVVKSHLETIAARIKELQNTGSAAQQAWLKASGERSQGSGTTKGAGDLTLKSGGVSTF